jgi:mRNA-degrading endonuclease toxin of MazEF toxin-antitoxin module
MSKTRIKDIKQGDIFMVNLSDGKESEEQGVRPCVCLSTDSLNKNRSNIIIAPITSKNKKKMINHYIIPKDRYDFFIYENNTILLECLRDISIKRLERKLGCLGDDDICNIVNRTFYNFIEYTENIDSKK